MKINCVVASNMYSAYLYEFVSGEDVFAFRFYSYKKKHTLALLKFVVLMIIRFTYCLIRKNEFVAYIPHIHGNYKKILTILRPHEIYLIDDGVSFEYESEFHRNYIYPIFKYPQIKGLIGPHKPEWSIPEIDLVALKTIRRRDIVSRMIKDLDSLPEKADAYIIDDGFFTENDLANIASLVWSSFGVKSTVIWHPSRMIEAIKRKYPAEAIVHHNPLVVVGRASTVLFNIASLNVGINVLSMNTRNKAINKNMRECNIKILEEFDINSMT